MSNVILVRIKDLLTFLKENVLIYIFVTVLIVGISFLIFKPTTNYSMTLKINYPESDQYLISEILQSGDFVNNLKAELSIAQEHLSILSTNIHKLFAVQSFDIPKGVFQADPDVIIQSYNQAILQSNQTQKNDIKRRIELVQTYKTKGIKLQEKLRSEISSELSLNLGALDSEVSTTQLAHVLTLYADRLSPSTLAFAQDYLRSREQNFNNTDYFSLKDLTILTESLSLSDYSKNISVSTSAHFNAKTEYNIGALLFGLVVSTAIGLGRMVISNVHIQAQGGAKFEEQHSL